MTAILINDLDRGGAQKAVSRILAGISEENRSNLMLIVLKDLILQDIPDWLEVVILASEDSDGNAKFTSGGSRSDTVDCTGGGLGILSLSRGLKKLSTSRGLKVIQSHLYRSNFINIASRLLGASHMVQVVNSGRAGRLLSEGLKGRFNLLLQRFLYPRADEVICKSVGMAADLVRFVPRLSSPRIIYNGYDIGAGVLPENLRLLTEIPNIRVISMGRCIPLKRHDITIDAVATIAEGAFKPTLVIYGEGELLPDLKEKVRALGMDSNTVFPGYAENPIDVMSAADILMSSSQTEGFPNVIVEAMLAGCLVVSTDCISGPREILAPGTPVSRRLEEGIEVSPYGILTAVDDVSASVEALRWIMDNIEQARQMVRRARERAEIWDIRTIVGQYESLLFQTPKECNN